MVARGEVASASCQVPSEHVPRYSAAYSCADRIARALRTLQEKREPVIPVAALITQQLWTPAKVLNDHVDVSIIVIVSEGRAPAYLRYQQRRAVLCGHLTEVAADILKQQLPLAIRGIRPKEVNVVDDVTIDDHNA